MKKDEFFKLIFSILICQLAGIIGSIFTSSSIKNWYGLINKPYFTPPNWIFAPVWTILFIMMGVSLWFVIKKPKREKNVKMGIFLFGLQLFLNILWSFLFFYMKNPLFGFIDITLLWVVVLFTITIFIYENLLKYFFIQLLIRVLRHSSIRVS
ncbi:MAG: TspO/MBR family protein [Candidatus Aenigmatarchaeota archaeon]